MVTSSLASTAHSLQEPTLSFDFDQKFVLTALEQQHQ